MNIQRVSVPIKEVTVYPESARIIRSIHVDLQKGINKIEIPNLPSSLTENTLRLDLADNGALRLKEIHGINQYRENPDDNLYKNKEQEIKGLRLEKAKLEAQINNLDQEFQLFINRKMIQVTDSIPTHRPLETTNWQEYLDYIQRQLSQNRTQRNNLIFELIDLENRLNGAEQNLKQWENYNKEQEHIVEIIISAEKEGRYPISLHYLQPQVSWHPAYTLRASTDEKQMSLQFFSMINQKTGEDWLKVGLHLSTAIPMENCDVPEIFFKRIKESHQEILEAPENDLFFQTNDMPMMKVESSAKKRKAPKPMASKEAMINKSSSMKFDQTNQISCDSEEMAPIESTTSELAAFSEMENSYINQQTHQSNQVLNNIDHYHNIALKEENINFSLNHLAKEFQLWRDYNFSEFDPKSRIPKTKKVNINKNLSKGIAPNRSMGGYDYRYTVKTRENDIPSLGIPIQTPVETRVMDIEVIHVAIPIEREAVFLKARFQNKSNTPLPSGPAQIYVDTNLLGNITFPSLGRNQGTEISLGIDQDIKILRKETFTQQTQGLMKKEIHRFYETEIEVISYKEKEVKLEIYDRLPLAQKQEEISIDEIRFEPNVLFKSKRNILKWQITLAPQKKQSLKFYYRIKFPEDFRLTQHKAESPHYEKEETAHE